MAIARFRKKPVVVEAMQHTAAEVSDVIDWVLASGGTARWHDHDINAIVIDTLEGSMRAEPGDWIIKGVAGEFYPCKPDIFAATYEPVADSDSGETR